MKIKGLYIIRKIAGETVVVPSGDSQLDSNVLIMLNETGEFLWNMLYDGADREKIIDSFCKEYDVDADTVSVDLDEFIGYIKSKGIEFEE
ncbi:MAG: PqqD family protein [Acutalibacteraceae bacterium]